MVFYVYLLAKKFIKYEDDQISSTTTANDLTLLGDVALKETRTKPVIVLFDKTLTKSLDYKESLKYLKYYVLNSILDGFDSTNMYGLKVGSISSEMKECTQQELNENVEMKSVLEGYNVMAK